MAEFELIIATRLKAKDPAAATAEKILARDMGLGSAVAGVSREDLWEIRAEAPDGEAAVRFAETLAGKTWVFYNPNKHILHVGPGGRPPGPAGRPSAGVYTVSVKTRFISDEKERSALRFLRDTFEGADRIKSIKKFTLWRLEINAPSKEEAEKTAEEIAVNRSIDSGLLANLSSQEVSISPAE